jgi:hypothetical protein
VAKLSSNFQGSVLLTSPRWVNRATAPASVVGTALVNSTKRENSDEFFLGKDTFFQRDSIRFIGAAPLPTIRLSDDLMTGIEAGAHTKATDPTTPKPSVGS